MVKLIDFAYNSIFCKVFNVKESNTISTCQYYSGFLPASCLLELRMLQFYHGLLKLHDSLPLRLFQLMSHSEIDNIITKYSLPTLGACSQSGSKRAVWQFIKEKLSLWFFIAHTLTVCCNNVELIYAKFMLIIFYVGIIIISVASTLSWVNKRLYIIAQIKT